jgi:hypothetical protein
MKKKDERTLRPLLTIRCKLPMPERRHTIPELSPVAARGMVRPVQQADHVDADAVTRIIHVMRRGMMYRSLDGLQWIPETDPAVPALPEGGVRITLDEKPGS